jgi:hypothetical protein
MAFCIVNKHGTIFYLHKKYLKHNEGTESSVYYFATNADENAIEKFPDGYDYDQDDISGMPTIRKVETLEYRISLLKDEDK